MKKILRWIAPLAAATAVLAPGASYANPTVGGGSASAAGCDITLAQITFDQYGNIETITFGDVQCEPIYYYIPGLPGLPGLPPIPPDLDPRW